MTTGKQIFKVTGWHSITAKMLLIVAATVFVCTLSTASVFLVENFKQSVKAEEMRLKSVASIFCAVLSGPVSENNIPTIRGALRALRDIPSLKEVSVHDMTGVLMAEMGNGAVLERTILRSPTISLSDMFRIETIEIEQPIIQAAVQVGSLKLNADISWLTKIFLGQIFTAILFISLAICAAIFIAGGLIRRATGRLTTLSNELSDIGNSETLHFDLKRESNDEVGILIDAFNDMMGRIDARDRDLRHYSVSLEDTVRKRTRELVIARDEAEQANAAKSEFLAIMSHEIRTPMNGMMVMAQMLAAAPLSPRHLRFAEIINRSGQNLLAIINDVLDISKIEAGKLMLEASSFSIDDLFSDINNLFYERARERGLELSYLVDSTVPYILLGDVTRLNQIITNLVNNALKFTGFGGVILHASAVSEGDSLRLTIEVTDTGIGIAKDKLGLVFEQFSQADQTITRRFGGTGLGLAISKRLVEAMDGTISVTSIENKGSCFRIEVLIGCEQQDENFLPLLGKTIGTAFSNEFQLQALKRNLQCFGAIVVGEEEHTAPDLILTDHDSSTNPQGVPVMRLVSALDLNDTRYSNRGRLELAFPVSRDSIKKLGLALHSNDFEEFKRQKRVKDQIQSYNEYRGLKALAVDDNAVNREVLNEALSAMSLDVDLASNGQEALEMAADNHYDIIFMDCSMPVMDGFTAARKLREREAGTNKHTPIVAITAFSQNSGNHDWRAAGMDAWIAKPFTIPLVAERITSLVLEPRNKAGAPENSFLHGIPQLGNVPLLDEQTVSMIIGLGTTQEDSDAHRIIKLFKDSATIALGTIHETSIIGENHQQIELLHRLKSVSQSAGARRLSWLASYCEDQAKSGIPVSSQTIAIIDDVFSQTAFEISARIDVNQIANRVEGRVIA